MSTAFELREQHKPDGKQPFAGGSFGLPDGSTYDIAEALEAGGGVIVTDDDAVIGNLRASEAFKQTAVGGAQPEPEPEPDPEPQPEPQPAPEVTPDRAQGRSKGGDR